MILFLGFDLTFDMINHHMVIWGTQLKQAIQPNAAHCATHEIGKYLHENQYCIVKN